MYEEVDVRKESGNDEYPLVAENHVLKPVNLSPRDTNHSKQHSAESHRESVRPTVERQKRTRKERAECCTDKSSKDMWLAPEHPKAKDIGCEVPDVSMREWVEEVVKYRPMKGEAVLR